LHFALSRLHQSSWSEAYSLLETARMASRRSELTRWAMATSQSATITTTSLMKCITRHLYIMRPSITLQVRNDCLIKLSLMQLNCLLSCRICAAARSPSLFVHRQHKRPPLPDFLLCFPRPICGSSSGLPVSSSRLLLAFTSSDRLPSSLIE